VTAAEPLVSVVIGTRNRAELLRRTLRTVLWQTHRNLEVLVVDDGSTDATAHVAGDHPDSRVTLVRRDESGGVARARNDGLARARGDLVAFTDDDDLWAPEKVASQLAALARRPGAGWSCVSTVVVDTALRAVQWQPAPRGGWVEPAILEVNLVPGGASGVLCRTELAREVGGFDPGFRHFADWDLWIRLARAAELAPVDEPMLAYLRHDSMSNVAAFKYEDVELMEARYRDRRHELGVPSPVGHNLHWIGLTSLRGAIRRPPSPPTAGLGPRRPAASAAPGPRWPGCPASSGPTTCARPGPCPRRAASRSPPGSPCSRAR
jgi:glycosyltransferase involved in cell wall biosynthesis